MIRILNSEPENYSSRAKSILQEIGDLHEEACNRSRLLEIISGFDVLIVRLGHRVDREMLSCARKLKAIVSATTGLNHIDLKAAEEFGIEVLCLKGEREFLDTLTATAELNWALLLGLLRRLPDAHAHVMSGGWDRNLYRGRQLKDKTLGVIGFGRLGSIVAEYGRAFRMRVIACDPFLDKVPDYVEMVELQCLMASADVISVHVNLDESTRGLIGRNEFANIKPGAVLINTSRGELVDENAMLEALNTGALSDVALDVLDGEADKDPEWPKNNPVWRYARDHQNIVLSPHIGGATLESMEDTEIFMAKKLQRFLAGEK